MADESKGDCVWGESMDVVKARDVQVGALIRDFQSRIFELLGVKVAEISFNNLNPVIGSIVEFGKCGVSQSSGLLVEPGTMIYWAPCGPIVLRQVKYSQEG